MYTSKLFHNVIPLTRFKDEIQKIDYFSSLYLNDPQVKVALFDYKESKGAGWGRENAQQFYQGEKYTLNIDSHMR